MPRPEELHRAEPPGPGTPSAGGVSERVELERRYHRFLGALSHELRNPLTPVRTSLYVLDHAPTPQKAAKARAVIERQVARLTTLLSDLGDLSHLLRGDLLLEREPVDLVGIVQRAGAEERPTFDEKELELVLSTPGEPAYVDGDAGQLAHAIRHLLRSAAMVTERGGRVEVVVEEAGSSVVLRVRDGGPGLTNHEALTLFDPFAMTAIDRRRGDLGVGLALARRLFEAHGGDMSAWSEGPGYGTEITASLPLHVAASPGHGDSKGQTAATGRRILVVEDNVDAAETLREALELGGHRVEVAFTGPEGLQKARALRPEIIFCDIGLPGLSGYELARAVREDDALAGTYLVALSGYTLPEDVSEARSAGFDQHLAKPPRLQAIEELIARAPAESTGGSAHP